jgi:hypothetical protein
MTPSREWGRRRVGTMKKILVRVMLLAVAMAVGACDSDKGPGRITGPNVEPAREHQVVVDVSLPTSMFLGSLQGDPE